MITIHIDTTKIKKATVSLVINNKRYVKTENSVLTIIDDLLNENGLTMQDITDITLETGPGSFTGLRVGAAIAGVLSLLLNIPINNQPPGTIPKLKYGKDLWGLESLE
ncbi:MAG: hypothetical protein N3A54_04665 [Patescibacteria group bacterium]|nr:hypothetical protein [Patescibacteria group bacterium]